MRTNHTITALAMSTAAVSLLAGCSSSSKPAAQTLPAATTPAATGHGTTTSAPTSDLSTQLLTVSDMPAGWTTAPTTTSSGGVASCAALNNGSWKALPSRAEADFQESQDGPFLTEKLAAGTAAEVTGAWSAFSDATSQCRSFTSSDGASFTLQGLSFPTYGDATYALALTGTKSGITLAGDIVLVRKGTTVVEVMGFGLGVGVPVSVMEQAVSAAVGKVG